MNTRKMITAALLAALTAVATMAIQIPTPLNGYVHLGDSLVLLSGIILGPVTGGLAAGIGSMLADLLSGYTNYALATLLIKALAAFCAGHVFSAIKKTQLNKNLPCLIITGICAGIIVTGGYFLYEAVLYGTAASAANAVFNLFQNVIGIAVAVILMPALMHVPAVKKQVT